MIITLIITIECLIGDQFDLSSGVYHLVIGIFRRRRQQQQHIDEFYCVSRE